MAAKFSTPSSKFSLSGVSASPVLLDLAALFYLKTNDFSIVFQFSVCFRYECWLSLANPSHLKKSSFHLKRFHCFFLYFIYSFHHKTKHTILTQNNIHHSQTTHSASGHSSQYIMENPKLGNIHLRTGRLRFSFKIIFQNLMEKKDVTIHVHC